MCRGGCLPQSWPHSCEVWALRGGSSFQFLSASSFLKFQCFKNLSMCYFCNKEVGLCKKKKARKEAAQTSKPHPCLLPGGVRPHGPRTMVGRCIGFGGHPFGEWMTDVLRA